MFKIVLGVFLALFISLQSHATIVGDHPGNNFYAVSDSQIQDFLKKFIDSSVANVMMLVEFITTLLRDAVGNKSLPGSKANNITHMVCLQ